MPLKPKIRAPLIRCGRCGKSYRNPLTHKCVAQIGRKPGRTRVKGGFGASLIKCGKCGKSYANPLTHVCTVATDFKKRTAEAAREAKRKQRERDKHDYQDCDDDACNRFPCKVFKEGRRAGYSGGDEDGIDGHTEGYRRGHQAGYAEGYDKGFPDGIRACPRPHKL